MLHLVGNPAALAAGSRPAAAAPPHSLPALARSESGVYHQASRVPNARNQAAALGPNEPSIFCENAVRRFDTGQSPAGLGGSLRTGTPGNLHWPGRRGVTPRPLEFAVRLDPCGIHLICVS